MRDKQRRNVKFRSNKTVTLNKKKRTVDTKSNQQIWTLIE